MGCACFKPQEPVSLEFEETPTGNVYCYRLEYRNGKYISLGRTIPSKPNITVYLHKSHLEKYKEKLEYFNKKLAETYYGLSFQHYNWIDDGIYSCDLQNPFIMDEILKKTLDYLNEPINLRCYGCKENFHMLSQCIAHKQSCRDLWVNTTEEKDLDEYLKETSKNIIEYNIDKKKEIVYEYNFGRSDVRPFNTMNLADEIKMLRYPVIFETDRYVLLSGAIFYEIHKAKLSEVMSKTN